MVMQVGRIEQLTQTPLYTLPKTMEPIVELLAVAIKKRRGITFTYLEAVKIHEALSNFIARG